MEFNLKKVGDTYTKNKGPDTSFFAMYEMHLISAKVKLHVHKDLQFAFQSVCGYLDSVYRITVCLFTWGFFNNIVCDSD